MGLIFSSIFSKFKIYMGYVPYKVLMCGLDNAGKSTIVEWIRSRNIVSHLPTTAFNVVSITFGDVDLNIWDMAGQKRMRSIWPLYLTDLSGIIYVVDSADVTRLEEASEEFFFLLSKIEPNELAKISILLIGNKQDLRNAKNMTELKEIMGVDKIACRSIYIQTTVASEACGLADGLEWFTSQLKLI